MTDDNYSCSDGKYDILFFCVRRISSRNEGRHWREIFFLFVRKIVEKKKAEISFVRQFWGSNFCRVFRDVRWRTTIIINTIFKVFLCTRKQNEREKSFDFSSVFQTISYRWSVWVLSQRQTSGTIQNPFLVSKSTRTYSKEKSHPAEKRIFGFVSPKMFHGNNLPDSSIR